MCCRIFFTMFYGVVMLVSGRFAVVLWVFETSWCVSIYVVFCKWHSGGGVALLHPSALNSPSMWSSFQYSLGGSLRYLQIKTISRKLEIDCSQFQSSKKSPLLSRSRNSSHRPPSTCRSKSKSCFSSRDPSECFTCRLSQKQVTKGGVLFRG